MKVRGAPAIAIVAALSLAVEIEKTKFKSATEVVDFVDQKLEFLKTSRPTAVNLFEAAARLSAKVHGSFAAQTSAQDLVDLVVQFASDMLEQDVSDNKNIGKHGADFILDSAQSDQVCVLTHCNTGSLATAGYGTALGIIRDLHKRGKLERAFCTETRPYNQGARLTAYELVYENMPSTMVCDNMVSALLKTGRISAIVVGADRCVPVILI
jgi:methylthioribose-1-phosphate isomerase